MSISKKNAEGYMDLTAYEAMNRVRREEKARKYRPLVCVCSPYAGDVERNVENARRFCKFSVGQGAIPLAPHLHYPQFMDDANPAQRKEGLWFAIILLCKCDEVWVFGDVISKGMKAEVAKARTKGITIRWFTAECEEVF